MKSLLEKQIFNIKDLQTANEKLSTELQSYEKRNEELSKQLITFKGIPEIPPTVRIDHSLDKVFSLEKTVKEYEGKSETEAQLKQKNR